MECVDTFFTSLRESSGVRLVTETMTGLKVVRTYLNEYTPQQGRWHKAVVQQTLSRHRVASLLLERLEFAAALGCAPCWRAH